MSPGSEAMNWSRSMIRKRARSRIGSTGWEPNRQTTIAEPRAPWRIAARTGAIGPTLAPGASPSYTGLNDAVGFEAADSLEVSYSAFGIARTATVLLQSPLAVVTGDASGPDALDCPNP
jgi:hypothetical protein